MGYGGIIGQRFDGYTQNQTLTQAVAALYGLGTDAVPNDVFNILSKSALYKNTPTTGLYTPTDQLIMSIPSTGFSPASVVTGSYVGTGTYGKSNPNTLEFDSTPKAVFVIRNDSATINEQNGFFWCGQPGSTDTNRNVFSISENTLYWYSDTSFSAQYNIAGTAYYYIAIL